MTRILVTGGRTYKDRDTVWRTLDDVKPVVVIHGGQTGADQHAVRVKIVGIYKQYSSRMFKTDDNQTHSMVYVGELKNIRAVAAAYHVEEMRNKKAKAQIDKTIRYKKLSAWSYDK